MTIFVHSRLSIPRFIDHEQSIVPRRQGTLSKDLFFYAHRTLTPRFNALFVGNELGRVWKVVNNSYDDNCWNSLIIQELLVQ